MYLYKKGDKMELAIEVLEEVSPKHPIEKPIPEI